MSMEKWAVPVFAVTGFLVSWSLIPLVQRLAACRLAPPEGRSFHHTHTLPISRFGGIAIVAGLVAVVAVATCLSFDLVRAWAKWGVILGALAMFALGLRDD